jgi:hypothetical protein
MDIMDDGQADRMDIMDIMDGMGRAKTMDRQRRAALRRWLPWTGTRRTNRPHRFGLLHKLESWHRDGARPPGPHKPIDSRPWWWHNPPPESW